MKKRYALCAIYLDPPDSPLTESHGMTAQSGSMPRAACEPLRGFNEPFSIASVEGFDLAMRTNMAAEVTTRLYQTVLQEASSRAAQQLKFHHPESKGKVSLTSCEARADGCITITLPG